jgi:hypothetical protein
MDHLTGRLVDQACPAMFMEARIRDTPSSITLAQGNGQGSFMTDLSPHAFEVLRSYLESGAGLPGRSFIYRRVERNAVWQAFCVVDALRLRPTDFAQEPGKNAVRIKAPVLARLRGLDPNKTSVLALLVDGTFVQGIPLQALKKFRDPVITIDP